jgi:aspartate beta-hydroxylase
MNNSIADRIRVLSEAAGAAARQQRVDEAAGYWHQVLQLAPDHPTALTFLGQHSLFRGDFGGARTLLRKAGQVSPSDPIVWLNLSFACRASGDRKEELAALERALAADPYCYPALLAKGDWLQKAGQTRAAARVYNNALTISPPQNTLSTELSAAVDRARAMVAGNRVELESFLAKQLDVARQRVPEHSLQRFEECVGIATGSKKIHTQHASVLYYPGLPPISFYDTALFPWLQEIEAQKGVIQEELVGLLKEDAAEFAPYVQHPDGVPLNQWAELNHSPRWSAFFLWKDGAKKADHCAKCPRTASAIERMPLAEIPSYAPTVFFSTLEPKTRIPPHTGATNARLIVHLPLIVPNACGFRVGNDTREWQPGQALVFDDTIEHEAWNDSDRLRTVLIFDIWNPQLSETERELIGALLVAMRDYYDAEGGQAGFSG